MKRYIPQLDGLRAIAVLLVIGTHTGYVPGGYVGVDIFFALSGYLITTILLRERAEGRWSLRRFYVRRARRLYPALILLLVASLPFTALLASSPGHYLAVEAITAAYLSDFAAVAHMNFLGGPLSHTWSLAVEEQFYLIWPLVLLLSIRANRRFVILGVGAFAAIMLVALGAGSSSASPAMFLPIGRGGVLLLGCLLAFVLDCRPLYFRWLAAPLFAAGVAAAVILAADKQRGGLAATLAGLMATGLIAAVLDGGPVARLLSARPLVWLGERSYGVYLWHMPIVYAISHNVQPAHGSLQVLIPTLLGGIALAALSYSYVETRFRRRGPSSALGETADLTVPAVVYQR